MITLATSIVLCESSQARRALHKACSSDSEEVSASLLCSGTGYSWVTAFIESVIHHQCAKMIWPGYTGSHSVSSETTPSICQDMYDDMPNLFKVCTLDFITRITELKGGTYCRLALSAMARLGRESFCPCKDEGCITKSGTASKQ